MARNAAALPRVSANGLSYSLSFNGTNQLAETADNTGITGSAPWSMGGWFKLLEVPSFPGGVMANSTVDASFVDQQGPVFLIQNGDALVDVATSFVGGFSKEDTGNIEIFNIFPLDKWFHAVTTYSGGTNGTVKVYLNGVQLAQTLTVTGASTDGRVSIGGKDIVGLGTLYSKCKVGPCFLYSDELTDTEVKNIYSSQIYPSDNAYGIWRMSDGSGIVASDSSGNGNDLIATNTPTWSTDVPATSRTALTKKRLNTLLFPYSLSFDGVDDQAESTSNMGIEGTDAFTFGGWYKLDTNYDSNLGNGLAVAGSISGAEEGSGPLIGINFSFGGSRIPNSAAAGFFSQSNNDLFSIRSDNLGVNQWFHLALTYSGTQLKLYINGQQYGDALTTTGASIDGKYTFGAVTIIGLGTIYSTSSYGPQFCYASELTLAQIQDIYANGIYPSGALGLWPLTEGSGTTVADVSGNNNHITLTGGPTWGNTNLPTKARSVVS